METKFDLRAFLKEQHWRKWGRKQDWADVIQTQSNLAARVPWDFRENKLTRGVGTERTSNRSLDVGFWGKLVCSQRRWLSEDPRGAVNWRGVFQRPSLLAVCHRCRLLEYRNQQSWIKSQCSSWKERTGFSKVYQMVIAVVTDNISGGDENPTQWKRSWVGTTPSPMVMFKQSPQGVRKNPARACTFLQAENAATTSTTQGKCTRVTGGEESR